MDARLHEKGRLCFLYFWTRVSLILLAILITVVVSDWVSATVRHVIIQSSAVFRPLFLSTSLFSRIVGRILNLSSHKETFQLAFDVSAMVLAYTLPVGLIEKHVLVADRADFER